MVEVSLIYIPPIMSNVKTAIKKDLKGGEMICKVHITGTFYRVSQEQQAMTLL